MPIRLREGSAGHRLYVGGAWLVVIVAVVYVPFATKVGWAPAAIGTVARIGQLNNVLAYAVALLGLNLAIGYANLLSLGQSAFIGLGAYTTVILVGDHHWSYFSAMGASAVLSFAAGLLIGVPAARIKGVYLAIVTLVIAFIFPELVLRFPWLTGGSNGIAPQRGTAKMLAPSWVPFSGTGRLAGPLWVYCILVVLTAVLFIAARNFIKSRTGRALVALRDHEASSITVGVNTALYKALTFAASAVYGGIAGSMLMMNRPFASTVLFDMKTSLFLVVGVVIGGTGTISGAVVGAFVYLFVPYFVTAWTFDQRGMPPVLRQITEPLFSALSSGGAASVGVFFGLAVIVLMFVLPGGFVAGVRRLRDRIVRVEPRPRWLR
jgi:branched-chain amino acid transport system permease protein